jgi:hypothetical protein
LFSGFVGLQVFDCTGVFDDVMDLKHFFLPLRLPVQVPVHLPL